MEKGFSGMSKNGSAPVGANPRGIEEDFPEYNPEAQMHPRWNLKTENDDRNGPSTSYHGFTPHYGDQPYQTGWKRYYDGTQRALTDNINRIAYTNMSKAIVNQNQNYEKAAAKSEEYMGLVNVWTQKKDHSDAMLYDRMRHQYDDNRQYLNAIDRRITESIGKLKELESLKQNVKTDKLEEQRRHERLVQVNERTDASVERLHNDYKFDHTTTEDQLQGIMDQIDFEIPRQGQTLDWVNLKLDKLQSGTESHKQLMNGVYSKLTDYNAWSMQKFITAPKFISRLTENIRDRQLEFSSQNDALMRKIASQVMNANSRCELEVRHELRSSLHFHYSFGQSQQKSLDIQKTETTEACQNISNELNEMLEEQLACNRREIKWSLEEDKHLTNAELKAAIQQQLNELAENHRQTIADQTTASFEVIKQELFKIIEKQAKTAQDITQREKELTEKELTVNTPAS